MSQPANLSNGTNPALVPLSESQPNQNGLQDSTFVCHFPQQHKSNLPQAFNGPSDQRACQKIIQIIDLDNQNEQNRILEQPSNEVRNIDQKPPSHLQKPEEKGIIILEEEERNIRERKNLSSIEQDIHHQILTEPNFFQLSIDKKVSLLQNDQIIINQCKETPIFGQAQQQRSVKCDQVEPDQLGNSYLLENSILDQPLINNQVVVEKSQVQREHSKSINGQKSLVPDQSKIFQPKQYQVEAIENKCRSNGQNEVKSQFQDQGLNSVNGCQKSFSAKDKSADFDQDPARSEINSQKYLQDIQMKQLNQNQQMVIEEKFQRQNNETNQQQGTQFVCFSAESPQLTDINQIRNLLLKYLPPHLKELTQTLADEQLRQMYLEIRAEEMRAASQGDKIEGEPQFNKSESQKNRTIKKPQSKCSEQPKTIGDNLKHSSTNSDVPKPVKRARKQKKRVITTVVQQIEYYDDQEIDNPSKCSMQENGQLKKKKPVNKNQMQSILNQLCNLVKSLDLTNLTSSHPQQSS